ncbi:Hypothetical_protein [Hexamita inflata]|uniref:Hypothetical_protein n=1 Tax=Hexamita inflata TaxID=28002 RepID=A0AA86UWG0_9EUKA|nr:Hypothetical protein HINF_LOCUS55021 [Hexamita inflata]
MEYELFPITSQWIPQVPSAWCLKRYGHINSIRQIQDVYTGNIYTTVYSGDITSCFVQRLKRTIMKTQSVHLYYFLDYFNFRDLIGRITTIFKQRNILKRTACITI